MSGFDMQPSSYLAYLAGSNLRLVIYFLLGGTITVLTAYFARPREGHGLRLHRHLALLTA